MVELCNELGMLEENIDKAINLLSVFTEFYQEESNYSENDDAMNDRLKKVIFAERMTTFYSLIDAAFDVVFQEKKRVRELCEKADALLAKERAVAQNG